MLNALDYVISDLALQSWNNFCNIFKIETTTIATHANAKHYFFFFLQKNKTLITHARTHNTIFSCTCYNLNPINKEN